MVLELTVLCVIVLCLGLLWKIFEILEKTGCCIWIVLLLLAGAAVPAGLQAAENAIWSCLRNP
jgi:hypothetical protein